MNFSGFGTEVMDVVEALISFRRLSRAAGYREESFSLKE
jgi:hypothetical protein